MCTINEPLKNYLDKGLFIYVEILNSNANTRKPVVSYNNESLVKPDMSINDMPVSHSDVF